MELPRPLSPVRGLPFLIRLASAALLITMLSIGKAVLVPIAIAFILAFILTAPLKLLIRWKVPRVIALALVMTLALSVVTGFTALLTLQANELADKVSEYTDSMRKRVLALQLGSTGPLGKLEATFNRVTGGLDRIGPPIETVRTVPAEGSAFTRVRDSLGPFAAPLAGVVIVFVLTLFFLSQREDLRNRLIRLAGPRNVTLTTRTLDEAGVRISRYLVAQTMINAALGALVALGLYLIGVPYPLLWGSFAAVLRFVPYVGSTAAALLPATLAFAIFPGWSQVLMTLVLFIGLDAMTAYFVEPVLIGHRTGVTAIALLVSTLFWSWLWGPIGLVLSTPLTVSLAVLGRHLPSLGFLSIILGDEEVLGPEVTYYQRLLADDEDEAMQISQKLVPALTPLGVMDQVLMPALVLAVRDRDRGEISDEDAARVISVTRENVLALRTESRTPGQARLLAISTGRESEVLLQMLDLALPEQLGRLEIVDAGAELADLGAKGPDAVVLAALPPSGSTPARELCRRLKGRFASLKVVVLRPDLTPDDAARAAARFRGAGADVVVATLAEALAALGGTEAKAAARPPLEVAGPIDSPALAMGQRATEG
jgi:predicted PurR-regulated permease PerM